MISQEGQEYNAEQEHQKRSGGSATIKGCDAGPRRANAGAAQCLQGKFEILLETGFSKSAGLKPDSGEADPCRARVMQFLNQGCTG